MRPHCPNHLFRKGGRFLQYRSPTHQRQQDAVKQSIDMVGRGGRANAILGLYAMMGGNKKSLAKQVGCGFAPHLRRAGATASKEMENSVLAGVVRQRLR